MNRIILNLVYLSHEQEKIEQVLCYDHDDVTLLLYCDV